ncbi:MAG: hypothetical protein ACE5H9_02860 [Anaerolineae bacterium]
MSACDDLKTQFLEEITPAIEELTREFTWGGLFALIDEAVQAAETTESIGSGPQKKACVIDIILEAYDRSNFDIPFLPNMFEKTGLKLVLDIVIDGIVEILNRRGIFVHGAQSAPAEPVA